jgi:uncharacterized alkaline shock family protein YloU
MLDRPAAQRGRTRIADRVLESIAVRAASEVHGVAHTSGLLGGVLGSGLPSAAVTTAADHVSCRVSVAVRWGDSITATAGSVRRAVAATVADLTGFVVEAVDVEVAAVVQDSSAGRTRNVA